MDVMDVNGKRLRCACCDTVLGDNPERCTQCQNAHYCNRQCQKRHWKNGHKEVCKDAFKSVASGTFTVIRAHQMQSSISASQRPNSDTGELEQCASCGSAATKWCGHCQLVAYCSRHCQKQGWKAGHKVACRKGSEALAVGVQDVCELRERQCPVCLEDFQSSDLPSNPCQPIKLPCSHAMCCSCIQQLRDREVNAATLCPLCRAELPPGPDTLNADAEQFYVRYERALPGRLKTKLHQRFLELCESASAQGSAQAQTHLGICYKEGHGVVQDWRRALQLWEAAAAQGLADAQNKLGTCYLQGLGVVKDVGRAIQLLELAAAQGLPHAQCSLGVCYMQGVGVVKDMGRAIQLSEAAAAQGRPDAQFNLAHFYDQGLGVSKDRARARELWELAAAQGHLNSKHVLSSQSPRQC